MQGDFRDWRRRLERPGPLADSMILLVRPVVFIRARTPSMADYSYGNSFDIRIKLNTDPITLLLTLYGPTTVHLTLTDPRAKKNFAPSESRTRDLRQNGIIPAQALCLLN